MIPQADPMSPDPARADAWPDTSPEAVERVSALLGDGDPAKAAADALLRALSAQLTEAHEHLEAVLYTPEDQAALVAAMEYYAAHAARGTGDET